MGNGYPYHTGANTTRGTVTEKCETETVYISTGGETITEKHMDELVASMRHDGWRCAKDTIGAWVCINEDETEVRHYIVSTRRVHKWWH